MFQSVSIIINHILRFGNFKITEILHKACRELLTGFEELKRIDTVFISEFISIAKNLEGRLIIDDTNHPKHCVGISRCQQHCMLFQEMFVWMCLVAFAYLERADGDSCYKTRQTVNFSGS